MLCGDISKSEHYAIDLHSVVYYVDCLDILTICFFIIIVALQHETDSFIEQKKVWR